MKSPIYKRLMESYTMDKALIPILEQHIKKGVQHIQVHRCIQKILRETKQKTAQTGEYLRLLKQRTNPS